MPGGRPCPQRHHLTGRSGASGPPRPLEPLTLSGHHGSGRGLRHECPRGLKWTLATARTPVTHRTEASRAGDVATEIIDRRPVTPKSACASKPFSAPLKALRPVRRLDPLSLQGNLHLCLIKSPGGCSAQAGAGFRMLVPRLRAGPQKGDSSPTSPSSHHLRLLAAVASLSLSAGHLGACSGTCFFRGEKWFPH